MKNLVILGGGFAGVAACKALQKHKDSLKDAKVILIDKHPYHVFTPSLYEVATSEEIKKNVALPLQEIFPDFVDIVTDTVVSIDTQKKEIHLKKAKPISYEELLFSLGSEAEFFSIPGLKEHAIALKDLAGAVRIKNKIKSMCCEEGKCNKKVRLVIGGGGFSGTELAAEMLNYKDKLARQFHLQRDCLEVCIIQGSDRLLKELDPIVSGIATKRLTSPQVQFAFGGHIKEVTEKEVCTDNGKSYPYDILVWTGGVRGNSILAKSKLPVSKRGQVAVDQFLQVTNMQHIFAAGDNASFIDKSGQPAPTVAQVAEEEGKIAGENMYRRFCHLPLVPYAYRHFGYVVPLRGHFAVAELMGNIHIRGFFGWILQQLVFLQYLLEIMPFTKAFMKWNTFELDLDMD